MKNSITAMCMGMMTTTKFVLASSSPRRRELLASLGIPFTIHRPEIDETQHPGENPLDYVQRLSIEKAAVIAAQIDPPALILAADTIVLDGADVLGKPVDAADARQMLQRLRGRTHQVCTALTLHPQPGQAITRLTCTQVQMRDYSDAEIDAYIATGDPFDKAGSYAIQHETFAPVTQVFGSYTNVIGLPLETLQSALEKFGF